MKHTKRLLAMLLTVCMVLAMLPTAVLTASAAGISSATPANGQQYIVAYYDGTNYYALPHVTNATTYNGTAVTLNAANKVSTADAADLAWTLVAGTTASQYYLTYTQGSSTYYLYKNGTGKSNYNIKGSTSDKNYWTFTASETGYTVQAVGRGTNNTYLAYNSSKWKVYGSAQTLTLLEIGDASSSTHTVTASASPAEGGTVTVSGNTITAVPNEGYYVTGDFVADDGIEVTYNNDNTFTFTATKDGEVVIEFKQKAAAVLTYSENGVSTNDDIAYVGDSVELLAPKNAAPSGYTFMGWLPTTYATSDTAPTGLLQAGDSYTLTAEDCTVYAVYAIAGEGGGASDEFVQTGSLTDGDYVFGAVKATTPADTTAIAAINATVTGGWHKYSDLTPSSDKKIITTDSTVIWTLANQDGGGFTLKNKSTSTYLVLGSGTGSGSTSMSATAGTIYASVADASNQTFELHQSSSATASSGNQLVCNASGNNGYRMYANRANANNMFTAFRFYKAGAGTSYTGYTTNADSSVTYTLDSIAVTTSATKTEFSLGETFSYDGLVITATYQGSNGTTKQNVVTPTSVSAPDMTTSGTKTVTVTYTEGGVTKTTTYQITVKATYTLTYDANTTDEVTGMPEDVTGLAEGTVYTLSTDAPVRKGYDFYGWAASADSDTEITSVTMDGNKTVYAIWLEKTQYTVSYYAKDGDAPVLTKTYYEGDTISAADVPTIDAPDGFAFKGWYGTTYGGATAPAYITPAGTTVNGNLTFRAVYAELGEGGASETFKLHIDGVYVAARSGSNTYLDATTSEADAAEMGYDIVDGKAYLYYLNGTTKVYIYNNGSDTSVAFSSGTIPTGSTGYEYWTVTENGTTITFKNGVGTRYLAQNGNRFSTYTPTQTQYPYQFTKVGGGTVTGYTTNPVVANSHTVTWYNADGSIFKTTSVKEGAAINAPSDSPVKADEGETYYTFAGWAKTANATTPLTDLGKMGTANMEFYPVFTAAQYTFTAEISGSDTLRVGKTKSLTATLTATPEKDVTGYTAEWKSNAPTIVNVDAATGKLTGMAPGSATITVTFKNADGTVVATATKTVTVSEATGGYTLMTKANTTDVDANFDWSGDYIIAGRKSGYVADVNDYQILTPAWGQTIGGKSYDVVIEDGEVGKAQNNASIANIDENGSGTLATAYSSGATADGSVIAMEKTGDNVVSGEAIFDQITEIDDGFAFTIEQVDDVNHYYTIRVKGTNYYLANSYSTTTGNNEFGYVLNASADDTRALWTIGWYSSVNTVDGYQADVVNIQSVYSSHRSILFNTLDWGSPRAENARFRVYGDGAYGGKLNTGSYGSGTCYNLFLFGNPNPFRAQIYYAGEQITISNAGEIPYGKETATLTSALVPNIDDYPNWSQVGTPTWSIVEKNNAMTIDPNTGVISVNGSASGTYALVQVSYVVHDELNNVDHTVSTQAKVIVGEQTATYRTVIYEALSGADTEVQYTVYKTDSSAADACILPLDAYVVNELTDDNSKTGSVVKAGTAVWSVVNNTDASETVSITADGRLNYANVTKDSILTVTVTGLTGDGESAGSATYKVYVKRVSYTAQITHDNGTTGDFTVPFGSNNIPLDKLVKNAEGATDGFTLDESKLTWATNNAGAVITKNADGTAKLDVSGLAAGTVITAYVSGMTATADGVTANVPRASVKITVGEQATDVIANNDTVIVDYDRAVTFDILANDVFTNTAAASVVLNGAPTGFTVNADMTVTFKPTGMLNAAVSCTYTVTAENGKTASATITVKPAAAIYYEDSNSAFSYTDGKHGAWTTLGTESVTEQTSSLTAADIVEFDTNYDGVYTQYSAGSVHKVNVTKAESNASASGKNPFVEFDFAGTGFDVVSVTSNNTGAFLVQVTKDGKSVYSKLISTYRGYQYIAEGFEAVSYQQAVRCDKDGTESSTGAYSKTITDANGGFTVHYETEGFFVKDGDSYVTAPEGSDGPFFVKRVETHYWQPVDDAENLDYYQIPVLKVNGLDYGVYHVKITAAYTSAYDIKQDGEYDFFFDAVRVHDPIANEASLTYISIRDAIIEAGGFGSAEAEPCGHTGSSHWELGTKASYNASETLNGRGKLVEKCDVCGNVIDTTFFYVTAAAKTTALSTETETDSSELSYTIAVDGSAPTAASDFIKSLKLTEYWKSNNANVVNCYNNANVAYAAGAGTAYVTLQLTAEDGTVYASAIHTAEITVTGHTHVWGSAKVSQAATCTTAGLRVYSCTVSGCTKTKTENILALGHSYGDWSMDSNEHWHVCARCSSVADKAAHNMVYDETLDKDVCSVCGYVAGGTVHTHSYTAAVTTEPTCGKAGVRTYTCTCGDSYTEEIPATGEHSYTEYTENGASTHYALCGVCGDVVEEPHTFDAGVTSGSTITYTCTKCGYQKTETVPEDTGAYTLVTSAGQLKLGDTIVIAASGYDFAVSSTQNKNNRGKAAITKDETAGTISFTDDAGVAEFTLGAGTTDGTYSFKDANGYLYAASSSSNYLRSESTLSGNSSWTIEFTEDGTATVKAQGTNTRNLMRYNDTSNLFSCYASGQKPICLYRKPAAAESTARVSETYEKRGSPEDIVGGVTGTAIIDGKGSEFSMEEFEKYGPKTEVYLSENQAVIFYLENGAAGTDVQIGAKAVNATPANLTVITLRGAAAGGALQTRSAPLVTATEMYYEIGGDLVWNGATSCAIVVANTGKGVMALTNVRSSAAIKLQINRATAEAGRSVMQRVADDTMIYGMDDFTTLLDSAQATDPTLPEDPIDPIEPTTEKPADPTEPSEPTEPTDPTEPTAPPEPTEPKPADPEPTEPKGDPESFTDLEKGAWYYESVSYAIETGLMNGVGEHEFAPDDTLTRAMLVTILYRQAGEPTVAKRAAFADVAEKSWYADAVAWAVERGITNGMGDNLFAPDEPVTREQMVTFLWRFAEKPESAQTLADFPDADKVPDYAKAAFAWAVEKGIVNGNPIGGKVCLDPSGTATRAQIAAIFARSKDLLAND